MTAPTDPPCPRRDRWIRGCRFEPRYDIGKTSCDLNLEGNGRMVQKVIEATKPVTYVRDVCVTCGRTIERAKP